MRESRRGCSCVDGVGVGCGAEWWARWWWTGGTSAWAEQQTLVFAPVADTRVEAASPTQNYGGSSVLKVDNSPLYKSFLRFDLTGLTGTVLGAKLRLYSTDATATGPAVYTTAGGWQEGA